MRKDTSSTALTVHHMVLPHIDIQVCNVMYDRHAISHYQASSILIDQLCDAI
jgi:hypothetical protein